MKIDDVLWLVEYYFGDTPRDHSLSFIQDMERILNQRASKFNLSGEDYLLTLQAKKLLYEKDYSQDYS